MTGRYARHSKVMTIANRLVKQGCNRATPTDTRLLWKIGKNGLNTEKTKPHGKRRNRLPMRLLLGANGGTRTPDLLITNAEIWFSPAFAGFNKWLSHAVFECFLFCVLLCSLGWICGVSPQTNPKFTPRITPRTAAMQATATDRFAPLLPLSGADRKVITQAAKARHGASLGKTAA